MKKIAVVYWSGTGNTEALAKAVVKGAQGAGASATLCTPADFSGAEVAKYDAIAFGCPAMGAEELEDGEFQPMFYAVKGALQGKKIALFGSYDWGDGEWMRTWAANCEADGLTLAAEPVICNNTPDDEGLANCEALGKALA